MRRKRPVRQAIEHPITIVKKMDVKLCEKKKSIENTIKKETNE